MHACRSTLEDPTCEALYYAHHLTDPLGRPLRVVHCDVSPQNILIGYDGSVKIVDFGIARAAADTRQQAGEVRGKAAYMSPEQVLGQPLDHSSDLFSLGVVLYELLSARRLFYRDDVAATAQAVREHPIPPLRAFVPDVPAQLDAAIRCALERDRTRRYRDARALQSELETVLQDRGGVPSNAVLGEFMSVLFRETLERRVFVENTMTAVIPLVDHSGPSAPTVVQAPPSASDGWSLPDASGAWPLEPPTATRATRSLPPGALADSVAGRVPTVQQHLAGGPLRGARGLVLGLLVGGAVVWWVRRPAEPPVAISGGASSGTGALTPLPRTSPLEPLVMELGPVRDGGAPASAAERALEPMAIRRGRLQRNLKVGYVTLATDPPTQARLGGTLLGTTPLHDVKVPAGPQKLLLENPALRLRVLVKIDVLEGEYAKHRFVLVKSGGSWAVARHLGP